MQDGARIIILIVKNFLLYVCFNFLFYIISSYRKVIRKYEGSCMSYTQMYQLVISCPICFFSFCFSLSLCRYHVHLPLNTLLYISFSYITPVQLPKSADSTNRRLCSSIVCVYWEKKNVYKWTCRVQTCFVQGSATYLLSVIYI